MWDDRVVAPDQTYTLDDYFGAEVAPDPRAPLTVEPSLGISLLNRFGQWNTYFPASEADAWEVLFAIREACLVLGVEPIGMSQRSNQHASWHAAPEMTAQPDPVGWTPAPPAHAHQTWSTSPRVTRQLAAVPAPVAAPFATPPWANEQQVYGMPFAQEQQFAASQVSRAAAPATTSDELLAALAHLSLVFLPVVMPVAVWLVLRPSVPAVAEHARQAALLQTGLCTLGLGLLAYALANTTSHGFTGATLVGLLGFVVLLAAGTVYAFYAAIQALHGHRFSYLGFVSQFR